MSKTKTPALPQWVRNLRSLMEEQDMNPRSLSLKAGLNSTAVRDMLEGRSRFPRYDTAQALAAALGTTPALLMANKTTGDEIQTKGAAFGQNLDLLTEIIARLQEVAAEFDVRLEPRDFAAMTASLYRRMQEEGDVPTKPEMIRPRVHDLLDYEMLRHKKFGRK